MDNVTQLAVKVEKKLLTELTDLSDLDQLLDSEVVAIKAVGVVLQALAHRRLAVATERLADNIEKLAHEVGGINGAIRDASDDIMGVVRVRRA